jgi:hypothetical protein
MTTLYSYNKQQFNADVSFNSNTTFTSGINILSELTLKRDASDTSNNIKVGTNSNGHFLYGIGSNPLRLFTNGSDRMRVDQSGNIGIGESSPDSILTNTKLQVQSTLTGAPSFNSWDNTWGLSLTNDTSTNTIGGGTTTRPALSMGLRSGNNPTAYISSLTPVKCWNNLMIDASHICLNGLNTTGNVGVGTSSPGAKLAVEYSGIAPNQNVLSLHGTNTADSNYNLIEAGHAASSTFVVKGGGNVGIGTSNPGSKLEVAGNVVFRGSHGDNVLFYNSDGAAYLFYNSAGSLGSCLISGSLNWFIDRNGSAKFNEKVGIGAEAAYPLHIEGSNNYGSHSGYLYSHTGASNAARTSDFVSVYASGKFLSGGGYIANSDSRIKNNIVDIDDNNALSILRKIQPKTYEYVDKVKKSNDSVIGFIAQEIKAILPKAVTITKDYIPNFYTVCQVAPTDVPNIVLVTSQIDLSWNPLHGSAGSANASNASDPSGNAFIDAEGNACSDASGNKCFNVKLYDQSNNEIKCKTTNVLDKRSFLMDISGSKMVDASGNILLENDGGYFLHGQEVDDFHNLDKNAIFTVVTAAVQDIDRKQVLDEAKIAALESQVASLQTQVASLQSDTAKIAALEARLAALEAK